MFNFKEIMKAKLVKTENGYGLEDVEIIAFYSSKRPEHKHYKLSKQNCDEIFGVIDVEKLADGYFKSTNENAVLWRRIDFKEGFNKAMELNRFTLEDLETVCDRSSDYRHNPTHENSLQECIKSLQQPTEIEVVIVMGDSIGIGDKYTPDNFPKLDENGCLILKKK